MSDSKRLGPEVYYLQVCNINVNFVLPNELKPSAVAILFMNETHTFHFHIIKKQKKSRQWFLKI